MIQFNQSKKKHSCDDCVERKIKCDGNEPCSGCVKRQISCLYSIKQKPGPKRKHGYDHPGHSYSPAPLQEPISQPIYNNPTASPIKALPDSHELHWFHTFMEDINGTLPFVSQEMKTVLTFLLESKNQMSIEFSHPLYIILWSTIGIGSIILDDPLWTSKSEVYLQRIHASLRECYDLQSKEMVSVYITLSLYYIFLGDSQRYEKYELSSIFLFNLFILRYGSMAVVLADQCADLPVESRLICDHFQLFSSIRRTERSKVPIETHFCMILWLYSCKNIT